MTELDQIGWDYLEGCIGAYLQGKQTFNWITAIIRGADPKKLREIIQSIDGDSQRKSELLRWLPW